MSITTKKCSLFFITNYTSFFLGRNIFWEKMGNSCLSGRYRRCPGFAFTANSNPGAVSWLFKCVLHLRKNNFFYNFFHQKRANNPRKKNEEFDKQKRCFSTSCQTLFVNFMQRQEQCNLWFSSETSLLQKKICQMT